MNNKKIKRKIVTRKNSKSLLDWCNDWCMAENKQNEQSLEESQKFVINLVFSSGGYASLSSDGWIWITGRQVLRLSQIFRWDSNGWEKTNPFLKLKILDVIVTADDDKLLKWFHDYYITKPIIQYTTQ